LEFLDEKFGQHSHFFSRGRGRLRIRKGCAISYRKTNYRPFPIGGAFSFRWVLSIDFESF
ncbi:MAG: hypothetical protein IKW86_00055, partial [Salinivirgaceae bacterium]|nr:hypothetical protein [Salinivirgaceae bacterium]